MLNVNEESLGRSFFSRKHEQFAALPHLAHCRGRRFAVCLEDPAEWIALCLYLRENGASVAPLHPSTPRIAAERLARRLECHALLHRDLARPVPCVERELDEQSLLVQTSSGTTGEPKAVFRTWESVELELDNYAQALGPWAEHGPLIACPVTHSYGLISGVLSALSRGVEATLLTNISPKYVIRRALEAPHSLLYASPALLGVLVRLLPEGTRLPRVMTSGAPLTNAALAELRQRTGGVLQQYGCSELGCVSVNLDVQRACEVGHPLRHLHVSAGQPDAPDEIVVRQLQEVVHTRDLGHLGERGLSFVCRLDDLINVAGTKVYPAEVEEVLGAYPGLSEAAVYRRADPYAGERVCLQFTAADDIDVDELRSWCSERLSPHQVPLEIRQVAHIPRLANGKLNRRSLAEPNAASAEGIP